MKQSILIAATVLTATAAFAKDTSYIDPVETMPGVSADGMARGTVFLDANLNSMFDDGETGIAGVLVSNGREVAVTDDDRAYELPAYGDMNLFITKPAGHAAPMDEDLVPQVVYVHKEEGSPALRFRGIETTGPLPSAINFPLIEDNSERESFDCLVFGDAQPYFNMQVSYVRETASRMLAARDNSDTECPLF